MSLPSRPASATHRSVRPLYSLPLALAAGFAAGFAFFRGPAPLLPAAETALREMSLSADARGLPDSAAGTDAKAQRLVAAARRKGPQLERQDEMYLAIEALTAEDFRRLAADVGALKAMAEKLGGIDWETSRALASGLIGRWFAVDPGTVMTWAPRMLELVPKDQNARGLILDVLATKRPAELLALVPSRKDAAERAEIISRALRELAIRDLPQARAWLARCTDPADRSAAEKAVRAGMVQGDPLRAIELAASMKDRSEATDLLRLAAARAGKIGTGALRALATTPMEPWMIASVIGDLTTRDPALAVDLLLKPGASTNNAAYLLNQSFSELARRDRTQAISRMENLTGLQLASAVSAIGTAWAEQEPAAALAWLAARPPAERANANAGAYGSNDSLLLAFGNWVERARGDATAWAGALPAGATRDAIHTRLAQILVARGEPAEATRLLANLGSAADPKTFGSVAAAWASRDPQAAADWAIAQPPGPAQSSALAGVVGRWANDNSAGVEDWLAQFPPGDARDRSIVAFLSRNSAWTAGNAERIAEFDAWFDLIDDPWPRAQAAVRSFWTRNRRDPAGARAWLSSLPNLDPEVVRITLRDAR